MDKDSGFVNFYEILEVCEDASTEEIVAAYRHQARQWHPDRNKTYEAANRMTLINLAREILTDEESRRSFDEELAEFKARKRRTEEAEARARAEAEARAKAEARARAEAEARARAEAEARARAKKEYEYYCEIVGVKPTANEQEIKLAYFELLSVYERDPSLFDKQAVDRAMEAFNALLGEKGKTQGASFKEQYHGANCSWSRTNSSNSHNEIDYWPAFFLIGWGVLSLLALFIATLLYGD